MKYNRYDLIVASKFDDDTIYRYTNGGCVFLAKEFEHYGLETCCLQKGKGHYAALAGLKDEYVIDIWGIWFRNNWHRYWKARLERQRIKFDTIKNWNPAQPTHEKFIIDTLEARNLASKLSLLVQKKGILTKNGLKVEKCDQMIAKPPVLLAKL